MNSKMEIVNKLVLEFGEQKSSFYNNATNKQREKFWTYNRTLKYYLDLKENFVYDKENKSLTRVKLNGKPYQ